MADPLFAQDVAAVKAALRLSGVAPDSDAHAMIEDSLSHVRAGFYQRLGGPRVATIKALPIVDNPTTDNEVLRSISVLCEVKWTQMVLLDKLPIIFMDASGGDQEFINQEGTFRSILPARLEAARARAEEQVEEWLAILAGDVAIGDGADVRLHTQSDQTPRVFPSGTLVGENDRLYGDPTRAITGEVQAE